MFVAKKVMIIDDSRLIRLTVRRVLESQDIEVVELDSVDPLLEEPWRASDLDLLLLDVNLPGTDGISALKHMRNCEDLKCLPVMMLSSYSDRSTVCRAIEYGAVGFMTKPIVEDDLINRITNVLGPLSDGVSECLHNEINRAKRGNTTLSILKAKIGSKPSACMMRELKSQLKEVLRSIDSIWISRDHAFIIVLPITGEFGCKVVSKKIRKVLECRKDGAANFALAYVSFPDEGDNIESLLAVLNEKENTIFIDAC